MLWNDSESETFAEMAALLAGAFADLPAYTSGRLDGDGVAVLHETARRLGDNYPYFHPLYAGQMLKPPHPVARLAYGLAMLINPNNHALDGGRASSEMEREAVGELANMFGWQTHLGHLTSGGTMANLEALWVGGALNRYPVRFAGTTPGLPAKTPPLRVAQLFAGSGEGSHFLLRDGAPVLVSYLEGDIDQVSMRTADFTRR